MKGKRKYAMKMMHLMKANKNAKKCIPKIRLDNITKSP